MRKWLLLILLFLASFSMAAITSNDLKKSRMAVYDWFENFEIYSYMSGRAWQDNYLSLFYSDSVLVYNDNYPSKHFDINNQNITVGDYVDCFGKEQNREFDCSFQFAILTKTEETYDDRVEYLLTLRKTLSYHEKNNSNNDNRYTYPEYDLYLNIYLVYSLDRQEMKATKITCDNEPKYMMIYRENVSDSTLRYSYVTDVDFDNIISKASAKSMIMVTPSQTERYRHFVSIQSDTLKCAVHVAAHFGLLPTVFVKDDRLSFKNQLRYGTAVSLGYSRLLCMPKKSILNFNVGLSLNYFTGKNQTVGNYSDKYDHVDADGGEYERQIYIDNYYDKLSQIDLSIPLYINYHYFLSDKFAIGVNSGIEVGYTVFYDSKYSYDATYKGYYDWLFDLVIDQNGFYDFGSYKIYGKKRYTMPNFNINAIVGFETRYFIASNLSFDLSMNYHIPLFSYYKSDHNFLITPVHLDGSILLHDINKIFTHNINLKIQFNYHF